MAKAMTPERLASIREDLGDGGTSRIYDFDLPLFDVAVDLLAERDRLAEENERLTDILQHIATLPSDGAWARIRPIIKLARDALKAQP
jgi:hypothetical protein